MKPLLLIWLIVLKDISSKMALLRNVFANLPLAKTPTCEQNHTRNVRQSRKAKLKTIFQITSLLALLLRKTWF